MPETSRIQLTLFVPDPAASELEAVRRLLDPVQARLIRAHVTLCREDELEGLGSAELEARVSAFESGALTLRFGPPEWFHEHGVLLPCVEGQEAFQALRRWILSSSTVRPHAAHITLAHPRNPKAAGNTAMNAAPLERGLAVTFPTVARIRQTGSAAWEQLSEHHLPAGLRIGLIEPFSGSCARPR
jgi:2'-5' RNA ligase